jgi:hypothetical protein
MTVPPPIRPETNHRDRGMAIFWAAKGSAMNVQTAITGGTVRSRTMRAAVLTGPGRIDVTRTPIPQPEAGNVRVRLEGCGVCASNLTPWKGPDWMEFPTAPGDLGHEGWGVGPAAIPAPQEQSSGCSIDSVCGVELRGGCF